MLKSMVVGSVVLASVAAPGPAAFADEPLYQCVVRAVEGGTWTDDAFEAYALGYAVHPDGGWMSLTCDIRVNGGTAASVSGESAAGGQVAAHGRVRFTASPSDNIQVVATVTTSHGTRSRSEQYSPHDDQPVRLPTGQTYDCGLDAVRPAGPAGENFEGVARGYVTRARGGAVTIRCYVRVDGWEQQFSSTATGTGTGAATTSGRVTFYAEPWSTVEIVAEVTTPEGTYSTAHPYSGTGIPDIGVDAVPYDYGCNLRAVREQQLLTGYNYEGAAYGYVTDLNADVTIRCYVTTNGWEEPWGSTPTGAGRDVATTQGRVTFYEGSSYDYVELCAEATSSEGRYDIRCIPTTTSRVPPQELVDLSDQVVDEYSGYLYRSLVDPLFCPLLWSFSGHWVAFDIGWDGDVFVDGQRVHDCPPYEWWDDTDAAPVADVITG